MLVNQGLASALCISTAASWVDQLDFSCKGLTKAKVNQDLIFLISDGVSRTKETIHRAAFGKGILC